MAEKPEEFDIDSVGQLAYNGQFGAVSNALAVNSQLAHLTDKSGRTLIHWSAAGGHADIVKILVNNYHVDPDVRDEMGWSPLIIASSAGRDDIVTYLLACDGVMVNAVNTNGQCALHYAASKDRFHIAETLLLKGAVPDLIDHLNGTPLHRAASKGNAKIAKLLVSYRADPNIRDSVGNTPLHLACEEDHEELVRLLVSSGADATVSNQDEKTPYDVSTAALQLLLRNLGAVERS